MQKKQIDNAVKPTQTGKEANELFKIEQVAQPEEDPNLTEEELDSTSGGVIRVSPRMSCAGSSCSYDNTKH